MILVTVVVWVVLTILIFSSIKSCNDAIKANGGIRKIAIEAGKEIKSIQKEIDESE